MFGPRKEPPTFESVANGSFAEQHGSSSSSAKVHFRPTAPNYPLPLSLSPQSRVHENDRPSALGRSQSTAEIRRIPRCFRSHRDLAGCFDNCAELFEPRVNVRNENEMFSDESLQDNVEMWFPLDQRPSWVKTKAYQRRQLFGQRRQREENDFGKLLQKVRDEPAAGSVLPGGKYPNSFDFSSGLSLQDRFHTKNHARKQGLGHYK
ncbi:unnamed protein product [Amoebophrya sp. A25]|nr:unnamed protein product [Amoebophrya sp. A25]|eukprot:GSA25T00007061001.1